MVSGKKVSVGPIKSYYINEMRKINEHSLTGHTNADRYVALSFLSNYVHIKLGCTAKHFKRSTAPSRGTCIRHAPLRGEKSLASGVILAHNLCGLSGVL